MTDADLIDIATEFRAGLLDDQTSDGMCFMVSAPLAGLLRAVYGVAAEVVKSDLSSLDEIWDNHVWIRLPDGRVLDATADQFPEMPPVYLGPPTRYHPEPAR